MYNASQLQINRQDILPLLVFKVDIENLLSVNVNENISSIGETTK